METTHNIESFEIFQNSTTWPYHSPVRSKIEMKKQINTHPPTARHGTHQQMLYSSAVRSASSFFAVQFKKERKKEIQISSSSCLLCSVVLSVSE
jgi:hypothetical protein